MSCGEPCARLVSVIVAFKTWPTRLLTLMVEGYGDAMAWSLMIIVLPLVKVVVAEPNWNPNTAVPIFVVLSCNWHVATICCPFVPMAVNVNGRETEWLFATSGP